MKKVFGILLIITLVLGLSATGQASEVQPFASTLIRTYSITISAKSGGVISASVTLGCYGTYDQVGFPSIKIQEKQSDGSWKTVESTSGQYKYEAMSHSYTLKHDGTVGKQYRATASYYAKEGSESDTKTATSATKTAID